MIKHTKLRAKWAKRLLNSKHFIVLTDKESVIYFNGLEPGSFDDILMLSAQATALEDFRDRVNSMLKEHQRIAKEVFDTDLTNNKPGGKSATKKASSANRTKIKVKG